MSRKLIIFGRDGQHHDITITVGQSDELLNIAKKEP